MGGGDPLEEGMATHSSILAWRIPWTEEPGRLRSMGSQRVRHNGNDVARMHAHCLADWLPEGTQLEKEVPSTWGTLIPGTL